MSEMESATTTDAASLTIIKFWTNELIWDKITSYLRLSDLKALSLVNKQFLDKIRLNSRFVFKQTLNGDLEVFVPVLSKAVVEVKSVKKFDLEHFGSDVFENVTHLELQKLGGMSNKIRNCKLKSIIGKCKALKSLAFGEFNFLKKDYQHFFKDEEVKQILSQLDELHIGIGNNNYQFEYSDEEDFEDSDSEERSSSLNLNSDEDTDPLENFKLFPDLNLKLKKFTFWDPRCEEKTHFYPELIFGSNINFLVDIDLKLDINGLERLQSMYIPNLTSLKLEFLGRLIRGVKIPDYEQVFIDSLIPFIDRHLETLQVFDLYSGMEYCLEPICQILKNSKKIRSLSLKSYRHFMYSIQFLNWDFLQTFSTLRSFQLSMFEGEFHDSGVIVDVTDLMHRVPDISDEWLRYLVSLPSTVTSISIHMFGFAMEAPQHAQVTRTLERFQNLTELSMLFCHEFLVDDTLQFICSHLTRLRIFKGDFSKVTDYGISGCRLDGSDSGISLKNLKGLYELQISFSYLRGCPWNITWNGLLKSVEVLELTRLHMRGSLKDLHEDGERADSKDGHNYLKLIQQNPSLETCTLAFYTPKLWFRDQARKLNPRLRLY